MTKTINDAPDCLNTNDKAMWVLGWNECCEQLQAELAERKRDAERYGWLRDKNWFAYGLVSIADYGRSNHETLEHLDKFIDSAIAAKKGEEK